MTNAPNPTVDVNTNRFTTGQGFNYDKNGNVIGDVDAASSLPRTFVFNGDNKQIEVKRDGVTAGRYYYDGEGKRVKKVADTETTVFVYSAGKLIAEYSTQLSQNPTTAYTTTDHLGSPRIITDGLGQVKSRRDFMPFGEDIFVDVGARTSALQYSSTVDDIRQKFTGYQKDSETQLDFAEARMYENRLGRFTAVDPLLTSGKSGNPQTFNRYVYVGNNPIVITDPLGLDWYQNGNRFEWFKDKPTEDGWNPVDFGDSTLYLYDGCLNAACDQTAKAALWKEGGWNWSVRNTLGCFADPKCAGIRDPVFDAQSAEEMAKFSTGFPMGLRNRAKSVVDIPNFQADLRPMLPPGSPFGELLPRPSLNSMFGVKPFFDYETPRPGSEALGAFVGERAFDITLAYATGRVAGKFTAPAAEPAFIGPKPLSYAPRVRMRAIEDPVGHNFPYSFDNVILSTKPVRTEANGYRFFQHPSSLNGKDKIFEIGVTTDFVIDHRHIRRQ